MLNHYIEKEKQPNHDKLIVFAHNCFSQNRNKYVLFFWYLVLKRKFSSVMMYFPIPGHSFKDCDCDFAKVEILRKKLEKVTDPMTYINLIIKGNYRCEVYAVNWNVELCESVTIKDYKKTFDRFFPSASNNIKPVRVVNITSNHIEVSEQMNGMITRKI